MQGGGGRNGAAGTPRCVPTTYPGALPVATHTLPLSDPPAGNRDQRATTPSTGTGSHRRPVQRADCAMGSMSPPNSVHHKGLGPTETGGSRPASGPGLGHRGRTCSQGCRRWPWPAGRSRCSRRRLPECRSCSMSGPRRRDPATPDIGGTITPCWAAAPAVLQRPRRIHTGVALPDRSHARVRRPALMLCLVHTSGIRCLAVLAERCTHHGLHHGRSWDDRGGFRRPCAPARGRGARARADSCWMPIAKGLTPHGLRHTHKTRMEGPRFLPRGSGNHSGA